jgi:hypothetical protein
MAEANWLQLFASSVGGGVVVKIFDYAREEYRRRRERSENAKDLLTKHHDPILKAADELVGHIRSLIISDFADFRGAAGTHRSLEVTALRRIAAIFYFIQFWGRVQLLRTESGTIAVAADPAGERLQKFIQHLESRAVRVVDRTWQRAAGEAILIPEGSSRRPMNLYEFTSQYKTNPDFRTWFSPLVQLLESTATDRKSGQRVMKYGVVLLALIDTLDSKHVLSSRRDPWPNKLTKASRKQLLYGTFRQHLPFVKRPFTYIQETKKGGPPGAKLIHK